MNSIKITIDRKIGRRKHSTYLFCNDIKDQLYFDVITKHTGKKSLKVDEFTDRLLNTSIDARESIAFYILDTVTYLLSDKYLDSVKINKWVNEDNVLNIYLNDLNISLYYHLDSQYRQEIDILISPINFNNSKASLGLLNMFRTTVTISLKYDKLNTILDLVNLTSVINKVISIKDIEYDKPITNTVGMFEYNVGDKKNGGYSQITYRNGNASLSNSNKVMKMLFIDFFNNLEKLTNISNTDYDLLSAKGLLIGNINYKFYYDNITNTYTLIVIELGNLNKGIDYITSTLRANRDLLKVLINEKILSKLRII